MINLLPPEYGAAIKFGRHNAALRRWLIGIWLAIGGLLIIITGGWLYLDNQAKNLAKSQTETESRLAAEDLEGVKKEAQEITSSIKVIDQVLSREILFSKLIGEIGRVLPPGTVLKSLTLNESVAGGFDIEVRARDNQSAARVATNLNDPNNKIFSTVDILSITCSTTDINPGDFYFCDGTYRALFNKETRQRFLNSEATN